MIDDYCYHVVEDGKEISTNVLRNKLDINNQILLDATERRLVSLRLLELYTSNPIKGEFDFNHLKKIHKYLFQDLYDWAGESRNCNLEKEGSHFCDVLNIYGFSKEIFNNLKDNNYFIDLSYEDKIVKLADLFGDINCLHPFREGNGRTQREFIEDLGLVNGLKIDITSISRDDMIKASVLSGYGRNGMLIKLFASNATILSTSEQLENIDKYCSNSLSHYLSNYVVNNNIKKR